MLTLGVFKLILFENYLKQLEKVVPSWDSKVPFLLNANLMFEERCQIETSKHSLQKFRVCVTYDIFA